MKSLRKIVFQLMDEKGYAGDQEVVNLYGKEPLDWRTVETYKTAWKKQNLPSNQ